MKSSQVLAACLLMLWISLPAYSDVISTTGQVTIISPPADARFNSVLESNTLAPLFLERSNFVLGSNFTVDFISTGLQNANPVGLLPNIPAGTIVNSYYLVTDPIGADSTNVRSFSGSITFNTDILGIIALDPEFASSNAILGNAGTLYSPNAIALEMGAPDNFTISADRRNISFAFVSTAAADNLRIVTSAVPEPSTLLLLAVAGIALLAFRSRKTASL